MSMVTRSEGVSAGADTGRGRTAAVVGAGMAGLTAAYRLQQQGWKVTVFESLSVVGGRVQSVHHQGHIIDTGATAVGASYKAYLELAEELGLRKDIVPAAAEIGIFRQGQIHTLNLDRLVSSGLSTRLLSIGSKLRLLRLAFDVISAKLRGRLDYSDMRRSAPLDTETVRQYTQRLLNRELDQYLCEPVVRTMLIADNDKVSKVELFSGIANIMASRVYSLLGGQGRFPKTLAARLESLHLNSEVRRVSDRGNSVEIEIADATGSRSESFDACVLTCPLPVLAAICPDRKNLLEDFARRLEYTQAITVGIGTRVKPASPAFLVQMPSCEDANVALMFLDHNKAPDRAPAGRSLIGCCWEAEASRRMFDQPDEVIEAQTLESVFRVFPELKGQVDFVHVTRWKYALPYTKVGAFRLIGDFVAAIDPDSRIQFAGDFMSEAGQNTGVEFGNRAATALGRRFERAPA